MVESQMNVDSLAILKNGDLSFATGVKWNDITKAFESYVLMPAFQENETCEFDEMEKRIDALVYELVQKQKERENTMKGIFCNRIYLDNESYDENGNIEYYKIEEESEYLEFSEEWVKNGTEEEIKSFVENMLDNSLQTSSKEEAGYSWKADGNYSLDSNKLEQNYIVLFKNNIPIEAFWIGNAIDK